jgi:hypothetical protein
LTFPDYQGENTFDDAVEFIRNKFVRLNKSKTKDIYSHVTCCTDTNNIKVVFNAVRDFLLKQLLNSFDMSL